MRFGDRCVDPSQQGIGPLPQLNILRIHRSLKQRTAINPPQGSVFLAARPAIGESPIHNCSGTHKFARDGQTTQTKTGTEASAKIKAQAEIQIEAQAQTQASGPARSHFSIFTFLWNAAGAGMISVIAQ